MILYSFGSEADTYQVLESSRGGLFEITVQGHEYPPIRVECIVTYPDRAHFEREIAVREIPLGYADNLDLDGEQFGLYEVEGGTLVGVFRKSHPSQVLLIADFQTEVVFSYFPYELNETEGPRAIAALRRGTGRELDLIDWSVYFGSSSSGEGEGVEMPAVR